MYLNLEDATELQKHILSQIKLSLTLAAEWGRRAVEEAAWCYT